jgi:ABC-type Zn uptake system ZnuABC Zn-binding protein ZnuA
MQAKSFLFAILLIAAWGWASLSAGGCRRKPEAQPKDRIHVVTTVYALADIVRQVGGERVNVEWFVESGQSLDQLVETPERRAQLRSADLIVTRGALDPWTLSGAGNEFADRRIVRVDDMPSARETDPRLYMWLDPQVGAELCGEIATKLAAIQPEAEKTFRENASELRKKILDMTAAARPALDASNGTFITVDPGFLSLARRMALEDAPLARRRVEEAPRAQRMALDEAPRSSTPRGEMTSLDGPTALDDPMEYYGVNAIRKVADEFGARAIFVNAQTPPALIRDWEARLKMAVLSLDATGSSALSGRSSYVAILDFNLKQLQEGMALAKPRERKREVVGLGAPIDSGPEYPLPSTLPAEQEPEAATEPEPVTPGFKEPLRMELPGPKSKPPTSSPFNPIPYKVK